MIKSDKYIYGTTINKEELFSKIDSNLNKISNLLLSSNDKLPTNNSSSIVQINSATYVDFVPIDKILYFQAKLCCTEIVTEDNKVVLSTRPIIDFDHQLNEYSFFRIDKSIIVNLNHVQKYDKKTNKLIMKNDKKFSVARRRKNDFLSLINSTYKKL